tara:strand:+ start:2160 stop:2525 length:366 start_codon:yes stop_codon:yes gene_type:complete
MKTSSKKGKGRRLQNFVKNKLYEYFPTLREGDIKGAVMGESGEDIKLSPAAKDLIHYSFECKNQERLNVWSSLEQAETNSNSRVPALVFKRNRSKTYIAIELEEFLKLIGDNSAKKETPHT